MDRKPIKKVALIVDDEVHELDASQLQQLNEWRAIVIERIDEINRRRGAGDIGEWLKKEGRVYTGAGGGGVDLTFSITPIGLGTVFKVSESTTGETVDLTSDNW